MKILIDDIDAAGNKIPDTYLSGDDRGDLTAALQDDLRLLASDEFAEVAFTAWVEGWRNNEPAETFSFDVENGNGWKVRYTYVP